jgi:acetyl-CoA synthetase
MSSRSYEEARRSFDWGEVIADLGWTESGPINLGHTIVDRHADTHSVALTWVAKDGRVATVTYRELKALSSKVANLLRALGLRQGDRVVGVLRRTVETIAIMIGTWKAGGVYVPIFTGFGPEAIRFRIANCDARIVCTHHEHRARVPDVAGLTVVTIADDRRTGIARGDVSLRQGLADLSGSTELAPCSRRDPAVILYTSGSTGEPKGVPIAGNFLAAIRPYMRFAVDLQPTDTFWPTGDPGWGYGFVCYHVALSMGVPVISWEATPTPETFLDFLEARQATNLATVPTLLRGVMALGRKQLKRRRFALRCISSCGEPLNSEVIRFFEETLGVIPRDQYGSSENGLPLGNCNALDMPVKPGSMGLPIPGFEMAVVDADGRELGPGEVGHLAQRVSEQGYYALGYWKDAARSAELFRHGWIRAGDLARRDESGYFWFEGRADDVIKSSGYRIGPFEVESAILHHPAVAEVAVVGKPDALRGHLVKAFVVLRSGHTAAPALVDEVQEVTRRIVGNHACPREVEFVATLPKTESGKIQRFKLRGAG